MSQHSAIGWTNATWNPVTGCSRVSPGCEHCYAEALSLRMGWSKKPWTKQNAAENVKLHPERLRAPSRWREPRLIFVNSMSDLFHPLVPDDFIESVFMEMAATQRHTYQVLTKRPERMRDFIGDRLLEIAPLPNVWLGVSAEDQRRWDERVEVLGRTSAAVRFVSAEPLLGPIDPGNAFDREGWEGETIYNPVNWLIIGGETGHEHRPMEVEWAESLARAAQLSGCAVFVKQASGARPGKQGNLPDHLWRLKEFPRAVGL